MSDRPSDFYLRATLDELERNTELLDNPADRGQLVVAASVIAWVLGDADEPTLPQPDWCTRCDGTGGWARPYEDDNGRVLDDDIECGRCEGSGIEP